MSDLSTPPTGTYRRIARRETHSPRSTLAIVLAVIVIVVCLWFATEIVLGLLNQPPLLVSVPALASAIVAVPSVPVAFLWAFGAVAALLGLVLIVAAVTPGRTARHIVATEQTVSIVDNQVVASALARHAAFAANVNPDNVRVTVSHRRAIVRLVPVSGLPVDVAAVTRAVDEQLAGYRLSPGIRSRVIVNESGKVGA
jgi:hypothetical protein